MHADAGPLQQDTPPPSRSDCWTETATFTLIDAWSNRQKNWQEVADAVNSAHAISDMTRRRTGVQCKNRMDTLKKKYKIEKSRVASSGGDYVSEWPFFSRLDELIGSAFLHAGDQKVDALPAEEDGSAAVKRRKKGGGGIGVGRVVEAVDRLAERYERVEGEKQRMMIELEKQRMVFEKDLEFMRMKMFLETQLEIEKIKNYVETGSASDGSS